MVMAESQARTQGAATSTWRHISLPDRGITYACDRPGPSATAPVVMLLHGWTATGSLNWASTITALSERYRVIALDHRGHGRGIRSSAEFTLEDCADDAVALLDVLGVRSATFVGYSMGGPIAQLVWRRHPERVRGLVLCATAADFTNGPEPWPVMLAAEQMQRAAGVIPRAVRLHAVRPLLSGLVSDPATRRELLDAIGNHAGHTIREAGREIRRFRSTEWIARIDVPVVVVVTERDRLIDPPLQRQLATMIRGSRTISVDGAHLAAFTQPDLIADAVAAACDMVCATTTATRRERLAAWIRARRSRAGRTSTL